MSELLANRYRVRSKLGRGGMGTVYQVDDTLQGNRMLAMKVVRSNGRMTSEQRLRFMEEFRAMTRLKHPNTLEVFDYGQLDETSAFFTMEIVSGRELTGLIREDTLPLSRICGLLIQLLQALGFIHSRLYVHRDIKSSNIRIKEGDVLKLMDFGLMDPLGTPSSGNITGTPGYLPPEVVKGGIISASSDIYSVGCLAYELIVGRLPFVGDVNAVIWAHLNDQPEPLRRYRAEVSPRMEAIVMRMLAKDQKERYQQVSEVIEDLAAVSGITVTRETLEQKKSYLTSSVLVGRDQELSVLDGALSSVREGTGRSVFIGAPAGTGKSRLAHEILLQAKLLNIPVLHGQCLEAGMALYEPMAQALNPVLALSTDEEIDRYGPVLTRLFPELVKQGIQPAPSLLPKLESGRLNDTIVSWLQDVTQRTPLILSFDDLHWIDPSSLEAFNHCIRRMRGHRLLCLATFRSEEAPPGRPLWFTVDEGLTSHLKLSAFDLPQIMLLLQAMLGEVKIGQEFAQFLFDATAGNAYFLTEVMRYLMEEGCLVFKQGVWHFPANIGDVALPTSVEATIIRRLSQLSPEARLLARRASVQGRYPDRDLLFSMRGGDEEAFFACIDELIEGQFIIKDGPRYAFPHDRVRETLYHDVPAPELQELHLAVALHLEAKHDDRKDAAVNELAHHFSRSPEHHKAYRYLRMAGDKAAANGIFGQAIEHWKQASALLDELPLPDREAQQISLLQELSAKAYLISPPVTADAYGRLIKLLEAQGDLARTCRILKVTGRVPRSMRVPRHGRRPIPCRRPWRPVSRDLARMTPPRLSAWVWSILESYGYLGDTNGYLGDPLKGLELFQRAFDLNPFPGSPLEGGMLVTKASCYFNLGYIDEIQLFIDRAQELLHEAHVVQYPTLFISWVGIPGSRLFVGFQGYRPSESHLMEALARCDEYKNFALKSMFWGWYAMWFAWTGRSEEALAIVEQMDQNTRRVGGPPFRYALYIRAYIQWQQGEFEEALASIDQALCYPTVMEDGYILQSFYLLRGQVYLSQGNPEDAYPDIMGMYLASEHTGMGLIAIQAKIAMGMLARKQDDLDAACQHLKEAYDLASTSELRNPRFQALSSRLSGEVALAAGDLSAAQSHLEEAWEIVTLSEQDNLFEQGQVQRAYGELHLIMGDREAAKDSFQKASDLFQALKNRYWLRSVQASLETLQDSRTIPVVSVDPVTHEEGRFSEITSKWQEAFLSIPPANRDSKQLYDTLLTTYMDLFAAQEASLFLAGAEGDVSHQEDGFEYWVASRDQSGPCAQLPVNLSLLRQVCQKQVGLAGFDLPNEAYHSKVTTFEKTLPSILVAPLKLADHPPLVIYLKRFSQDSPFENRDRDLLSSFSEGLASSMSLATAQESALEMFPSDERPSLDPRRLSDPVPPAGDDPSFSLNDRLLAEFSELGLRFDNERLLCDRLAELSLGFIGAERVRVVFYEGTVIRHQAVLSRGEASPSTSFLAFTEPFLSRSESDRRVVKTCDLDPDLPADSRQRNVMVIPLVNRGERLGMIYADASDREEFFRTSGMSSLLLLASFVSAGLTNSRLLARTEAASRAAKALSEVAHAVAGTADPEDLAETILEQCLRVTGAERGFVLLGAELKPLAAFDNQHRPLSIDRFSQSLAKRTFETCQAMVMTDVPPEHDASSGSPQRATQSVICVPVAAKNQAMGVLYVSSHLARLTFGTEDLALLEAIAAQAAMAFKNDMLFRDLQKTLGRERKALREKSGMARYMSSAALRAAESTGEKDAQHGRLQLVTIMFIDVRGFTTMSERTDPRDVVLILNTYLSCMEQIVLDHGGYIDKFIGDGIMAVFMHEATNAGDAAHRAVETAIAMQAAMADLNEQKLFPGDEVIRIGIGINTGEVVVGNIGATTRMDYTVIGDNVNLAARLESNAKPGTIMVSASTAAWLGTRFALKPFGALTVKGKTQPVEVFTVDLDAGSLAG